MGWSEDVNPKSPPISSIKIFRSHQKLQTQLAGDIYVRDIVAVLVLLVVVEIFDDFLQDLAVDFLKVADAGDSFGKVA